MRKLILTAALLGAATTAAADSYWHKGVTVSGTTCQVNSSPNEDRHYWMDRLAIPEHSVEASIEYHKIRTGAGTNFHAAAVCWLEDRGDALVFMDNGGDNDDNWHDLGFGSNIVKYIWSYEDKIEFYNRTNGDIVPLPTTNEQIGWNTTATKFGGMANVIDGLSPADMENAWFDYHIAGVQDLILRPFKQGWEAKQGTYVAAVESVEAQPATYNAPASVGNINGWFTDLAGLNSEINFYLGHTNRQPRNFLLSDDDGETYRISATLTWEGNIPTVLRETIATPAVEAQAGSPAMYGGFPLTDWTESLGL